MNLSIFKKTLMFVAAAVFFTAASASADTITYILDAGNAGISGYTGPYGEISVTLTDSNTATITMTAYSTASNIYLFGDGGSVGLNTNGSATFNTGSVSGITQPQNSPVAPILTSGGAGNEDGWGSFNFTLNNFDGFKNAFATLTFTIDKTSGTWANAADVLTANADGNTVAAHIFVANSDGSNTGSTGFATDGGTSVPDGGSTVTLLGSALVAFSLLRRRVNRN